MKFKKVRFHSSRVHLVMVLSALNLAGQNNTGWRASSETIQKMSESRPQLNFFEEKVPEYTLPDLLTTLDGEKVTNAKRWNQSWRPEILELFRENVFGRVPETAFEKSYKVVNVDNNAMNGTATLK